MVDLTLGSLKNHMMKEEGKKKGPACACGKGDLYEEWLKAETEKKDASDKAATEQARDNSNSNDSTGKED